MQRAYSLAPERATESVFREDIGAGNLLTENQAEVDCSRRRDTVSYRRHIEPAAEMVVQVLCKRGRPESSTA